jgi:hypothetical protein
MLEFSATYLRALRDALEKASALEPVRARVTPSVATMLNGPGAQPWWPEAQMVELLHAMADVLGDEGIKAIAIDASRTRMGPLSRPLVNVLLLVAGATPDTLFSRVGPFVALGVRPVKARWTRTSPTSGGLAFEYPGPVPARLGLLWWGLLAEAFALVKAGRVTSHDFGSTVHRFTIDWAS